MWRPSRSRAPCSDRPWPLRCGSLIRQAFGPLGSNLALAALLVEKKIPHEYRQQPGVHNWELWDKQIREVLELAAEKLPRR